MCIDAEENQYPVEGSVNSGALICCEIHAERQRQDDAAAAASNPQDRQVFT